MLFSFELVILFSEQKEITRHSFHENIFSLKKEFQLKKKVSDNNSNIFFCLKHLIFGGKLFISNIFAVKKEYFCWKKMFIINFKFR